MVSNLENDKKELRRLMRARRRAVSTDEKAATAAAICTRLLDNPRVKAAGCVAVYLAGPDEIDLSECITGLLAKGVRVVAPRWTGDTYELAPLGGLSPANSPNRGLSPANRGGLGAFDLVEGPHGILEPRPSVAVAPADVDVWLVPGLAFTSAGGRLGYGGGWYDRFLAAASAQAVFLGIAYSFQVVSDLPLEPHDRPLTEIVTVHV